MLGKRGRTSHLTWTVIGQNKHENQSPDKEHSGSNRLIKNTRKAIARIKKKSNARQDIIRRFSERKLQELDGLSNAASTPQNIVSILASENEVPIKLE